MACSQIEVNRFYSADCDELFIELACLTCAELYGLLHIF